MAALIGAVAHDLDHPGVNQHFLISTSNHLAILYQVREVECTAGSSFSNLYHFVEYVSIGESSLEIGGRLSCGERRC